MHIAALIITTAYMYYQEHSFFPLYKCSRQFCRFVTVVIYEATEELHFYLRSHSITIATDYSEGYVCQFAYHCCKPIHLHILYFNTNCFKNVFTLGLKAIQFLMKLISKISRYNCLGQIIQPLLGTDIEDASLIQCSYVTVLVLALHTFLIFAQRDFL